MNSAATETQHKCSCGRTFRHGISLKRHQKVSGCAEMEGTVEVAAPAAPAAIAPIAAPTAVPTEDFGDESGSVVITAQQIARWQQQKNGRPAAPAPAAPAVRIDWDGVRGTCAEFASFTGEQFGNLGRVLGWVAGIGARFTIFTGFVVTLGYVILFGISRDLSAAPTTAVDRTQAAEMSARSTVNSFLQTAQLNQFDRARDFLTNKTRETVSSGDLKAMLNTLPLRQAPESVSSALEQDGRVAKVTVVRNGSAEIYTLVAGNNGWGLASVSVRRS